MQGMPNSAAQGDQEVLCEEVNITQNVSNDAAVVRDPMPAGSTSDNATDASNDVADDAYAVPDEKKKSDGPDDKTEKVNLPDDLPDDLPEDTDIMDNELYGTTTDMSGESKPQTTEVQINLPQDA